MLRMTAFVLIGLLTAAVADAQSMYKYRGPGGEWIFSDRPPPDGDAEEVRMLAPTVVAGSVAIETTNTPEGALFVVSNRFHAPVELFLRFRQIRGYEYPDPDEPLRWVIPPVSERTLLTLVRNGTAETPATEYEYTYQIGDPRARHAPVRPYRVPFSVASAYPVTQAYPDIVTHSTPDSYHAVDIAMPVGTDIVAARAGIVFDVASDNYRSGMDRQRDGPAANVVKILHDDGTWAIYAHLNWNSIRVKPGDRVARGEYIADSGNTGFSSGPHLHFAVLRNAGLMSESVPVRFEGANSTVVTPATGSVLTAY
jgi:murein DD-endopeptidase MepM/ murein hydrolase activator NlpD